MMLEESMSKVSKSYSFCGCSMADGVRRRCPFVVVIGAFVPLAKRKDDDTIKDIQRWTFGYFKT